MLQIDRRTTHEHTLVNIERYYVDFQRIKNGGPKAAIPAQSSLKPLEISPFQPCSFSYHGGDTDH